MCVTVMSIGRPIRTTNITNNSSSDSIYPRFVNGVALPSARAVNSRTSDSNFPCPTASFTVYVSDDGAPVDMGDRAELVGVDGDDESDADADRSCCDASASGELIKLAVELLRC